MFRGKRRLQQKEYTADQIELTTGGRVSGGKQLKGNVVRYAVIGGKILSAEGLKALQRRVAATGIAQSKDSIYVRHKK